MVIIQRHMTLCNGHYPTPHVNIQVPHFPGHTHSQTQTPSPAAVPGIPTTLPSHLWPPWLTISIKHTARNWRGIQWELSACEYLVATHPQPLYEIWCEERWSQHKMTVRSGVRSVDHGTRWRAVKLLAGSSCDQRWGHCVHLMHPYLTMQATPPTLALVAIKSTHLHNFSYLSSYDHLLMYLHQWGSDTCSNYLIHCFQNNSTIDTCYNCQSNL